MLAVVALVLIACEVALRQVEVSLSTDLEHIDDFPRIVKRLHDDPRPSVLFLGNSLTGCGADVPAFRDEWTRLGRDDVCDKVSPDGTALSDWYYIYKTFLAEADQVPDVVIIGFSRRHLHDDLPVSPKRLGRHFCKISHTTELFEHDLLDIESRGNFLFSWASTVYGNQPQIKKRALDMVIPNYRQGSRTINDWVGLGMDKAKKAAAKKDGKKPPKVTCRRLERLLGLMKETGTRGVFVAMPRPNKWEVKKVVKKTILDAGMTFVDFRGIEDVEGLTAKHFADKIHLTPSGAKIYSRALARELARRFDEANARTNSVKSRASASGTTTPGQ